MNLSNSQKSTLYSVFRILVGYMFLIRGGQKLFGWFSESGPVELMSLMGLAGIIEFFGGLFIVLGLYTSVVALIAALEMAYAHVFSHASKADGIAILVPRLNNGEPSLMFFVAFLVLIAYGAGKWSLEKKLFKKEIWHKSN